MTASLILKLSIYDSRSSCAAHFIDVNVLVPQGASGRHAHKLKSAGTSSESSRPSGSRPRSMTLKACSVVLPSSSACTGCSDSVAFSSGSGDPSSLGVPFILQSVGIELVLDLLTSLGSGARPNSHLLFGPILCLFVQHQYLDTHRAILVINHLQSLTRELEL